MEQVGSKVKQQLMSDQYYVNYIQLIKEQELDINECQEVLQHIYWQNYDNLSAVFQIECILDNKLVVKWVNEQQLQQLQNQSINDLIIICLFNPTYLTIHDINQLIQSDLNKQQLAIQSTQSDFKQHTQKPTQQQNDEQYMDIEIEIQSVDQVKQPINQLKQPINQLKQPIDQVKQPANQVNPIKPHLNIQPKKSKEQTNFQSKIVFENKQDKGPLPKQKVEKKSQKQKQESKKTKQTKIQTNQEIEELNYKLEDQKLSDLVQQSETKQLRTEIDQEESKKVMKRRKIYKTVQYVDSEGYLVEKQVEDYEEYEEEVLIKESNQAKEKQKKKEKVKQGSLANFWNK